MRCSNAVVAFAVAVVAAAAFASSAAASCIPATEAQHQARANVIFVGQALDGPTATGIQRFRVSRYLKGNGPSVLRVDTGYVRHENGGVSLTSVSLVVKRGERWRIFARSTAAKVLRSNFCDGSRKS